MKPGEALHWQPRPFAFPDLPDALCREVDPEVFFPELGGTTTNAKKICRRCEELDACLQWALEHQEEFGVWGGLSVRQRKKLLQKGGVG